jgi:hypothetical protein
MSSQRRIEASRANGTKSRGPVTPEGKAVSLRNRTRHGLLARSVVLEGENRVLFYRLFNDLHEEFGPATAVENALVETLAVASWRQMRIWGIEKAGLDYQISKQDEPVDPPTKAALAFQTLSDGSRSLELINRYETRYDRQFNRALARLISLRAPRLGDENFHSNLVPKTDNVG